MIPLPDVLLRLLIAHVLGDFLFQPKRWVDERNQKHLRSPSLYFHGLLHGALALVALWDLSWWPVALCIGITHMVIDVLKSYQARSSAKWFVLDQVLHVVVIFVAWSVVAGIALIELFDTLWIDRRALPIVLGILLLSRPVSFFIAVFTSRWWNELGGKRDNLPDAGMWIGMIERLLIFVFILNNVFEAVGFLLAAKSIFRFGDLKDGEDRKRTEYVLIGTLLSFGIAVVVGIGVQHFPW